MKPNALIELSIIQLVAIWFRSLRIVPVLILPLPSASLLHYHSIGADAKKNTSQVICSWQDEDLVFAYARSAYI